MGASAKSAPARGKAAASSDEPLGAWRVVHDHGDVFETFCVGVFYFTSDKMGFTNDSNVHVWEVPLSALKEVAKNAVYGADKQAFHVRLVTNTNYDFIAVNDQLQFLPSDPIIIALLNRPKP
jgi:hypothetical protein